MSEDFAARFEADVDGELRRKLDSRSSQLEDLIQRFSERNSYLRQRPPLSVQSPEAFEARPVPPELLSRLHQTNRDLKLLQQRRLRLESAFKLLDRRIESASRIRAEKKREHARESMGLLSATAQTGIHGGSRPVDPARESVVELDMFRRQLAAIEDLRSGAKPKLCGDVPVNIDSWIAGEEEQARRHAGEVDRLLEQLQNSLKHLYEDGTAWKTEVYVRNRVSDAFAAFVGAYQKGKYNLSTFKLRVVSEALKSLAARGGDWNATELLQNLESERQFLIEELVARGIGDAEMDELKKQIEIQLLYLQHLTAVAGSALCRVGTHQPPVDVLERMKVDIAEMEQREALK